MELFEEIRREYEFGVGTIQGVARKLGEHRRMVRQALAQQKSRDFISASVIEIARTFRAFTEITLS